MTTKLCPNCRYVVDDQNAVCTKCACGQPVQPNPITEQYRSLYLEDLGRMESYDGKQPRSRVYNVEAWKNIRSQLNEKWPWPITLPVVDQTRDVWVLSDTHFSHKNILKYCNRPYPTYELMNECLIGNYQSVVKPNDICIWVGDVGFGSDQIINDKLNQLNGYKILVIGNHDLNHSTLRKLAFDEIHLLYYLRVEDEDLDMVFTHYPQDNLPLNIINIHGHVHNKNTDVRSQINVSVENIDYKPRNLKDIIKEAKERVSIYKD